MGRMHLLPACLCTLLCASLCTAEPALARDALGDAVIFAGAYGSDGFQVHVPPSYRRDRPAGLLLSLHGKGGADAMRKVPARKRCAEQNLIFLAPLMTAKDAQADPRVVEGIQAAITTLALSHALAPGRGQMVAFSYGVTTAANLWKAVGGRRGPTFPFCAVQIESGTWAGGAAEAASPEIAFVTAVGADEWKEGGPGERRGTTMMQAVSDRLALALRDEGNPDQLFLLCAGEGHKYHPAAKDAGLAQFARAAAFLAGVADPAGTAPHLRPAVEQANRLELAAAMATARRVGGAEAELLVTQVQARAAEMLAGLRTVAAEDALLAAWYGRRAAACLRGLPEGEEAAALAATAANAAAAARRVLPAWQQQYTRLAVKGAANAALVPQMEAWRAAAGAGVITRTLDAILACR